MEEKIMFQRTEIDWLRKGDDNSAFFHAYLKSRHEAKSMRILKNTNGIYITEQQQIEHEVMEFYSNLMGKANHHLHYIDLEAMRNGNQLNMEQRNSLIS